MNIVLILTVLGKAQFSASADLVGSQEVGQQRISARDIGELGCGGGAFPNGTIVQIPANCYYTGTVRAIAVWTATCETGLGRPRDPAKFYVSCHVGNVFRGCEWSPNRFSTASESQCTRIDGYTERPLLIGPCPAAPPAGAGIRQGDGASCVDGPYDDRAACEVAIQNEDGPGQYCTRRVGTEQQACELSYPETYGRYVTIDDVNCCRIPN